MNPVLFKAIVKNYICWSRSGRAIEKQAQLYQNGSNKCNRCSEEQIAILHPNSANTLNKGTELVSKCRNKAKLKLRNHQPIKSH